MCESTSAMMSFCGPSESRAAASTRSLYLASGELQKNEIAPRRHEDGTAECFQRFGPRKDLRLPLPLSHHDIDLIGHAADSSYSAERVIMIALADPDRDTLACQFLPCRKIED